MGSTGVRQRSVMWYTRSLPCGRWIGVVKTAGISRETAPHMTRNGALLEVAMMLEGAA